MSLNTQHMYKKLDVVALFYNPSVKEVEKAGLRLTQAGCLGRSLSPRFSERPCYKRIGWRTTEDST